MHHAKRAHPPYPTLYATGAHAQARNGLLPDPEHTRRLQVLAAIILAHNHDSVKGGLSHKTHTDATHQVGRTML
ncbi:MAG: hypothetical protein JXB35_03185, partial [Anaerolineae bacterium]|nr:hypothetical protein [Anaerolineae bacterium]